MMTGGSVSLIVTAKAQALVLPAASVTMQLTVASPLLNVEPLAGVQTKVEPEQLSVTVGTKTTLLLLH